MGCKGQFITPDFLSVPGERCSQHQIVDHQRCRCDVVFRLANITQAMQQIDFTVVAKVSTTLTALRVKGNEAGIQRAGKDPSAALTLSASRIGFLPMGNTPTGWCVNTADIDLGVKRPAFLPGFRVQSDNPTERRAEKQCVIDD